MLRDVVDFAMESNTRGMQWVYRKNGSCRVFVVKSKRGSCLAGTVAVACIFCLRPAELSDPCRSLIVKGVESLDTTV
jgi:hypothetical protein